MTIDGIFQRRCVSVIAGIQVHDQLMAEKIEINPKLTAAPLGAAEQPTVECPGLFQIVDRNRQVKGLKARLIHWARTEVRPN